MTAKELTSKIVQIRKTIDYKKTKILLLEEQTTNTAPSLTGMPHNPSGDKSPMATAICKKINLEREIAILAAERNEYIAKFDLLEDGDLQRILTLRYVEEAKWDNIMADMGYAHSHIYRLHAKALSKLESILERRD